MLNSAEKFLTKSSRRLHVGGIFCNVLVEFLLSQSDMSNVLTAHAVQSNPLGVTALLEICTLCTLYFMHYSYCIINLWLILSTFIFITSLISSVKGVSILITVFNTFTWMSRSSTSFLQNVSCHFESPSSCGCQLIRDGVPSIESKTEQLALSQLIARARARASLL